MDARRRGCPRQRLGDVGPPPDADLIVDDELPVEDAPENIEQVPPVANDDELGARPGRTTLLRVMVNDSDDNGDPIMITEVGETPAQTAISQDGQGILLTLDSTASGQLQVPYTISDGRGGEDSAVATVTISAPDQNSPPEQALPSTLRVAANGTVSANVLNDWIDPDGDELILVSAAVAGGDDIRYRPDGRIEFTDGGVGALRDIDLVVSDGREQSTGSVVVAVSTDGAPPLVADSFAVFARAGESLELDPLLSAHGGQGPIALHNVPQLEGATVRADFAANRITVIPEEPGSLLLEYVVTDGQSTATGNIRIEVAAAVDVSTPPQTSPHVVAIPPLATREIDVTTSDLDPSGSVLLVTGTTVGPDTPVVATVIEQRTIRLTLTDDITGPVDVNYTISNGASSSTGTITVIQVGATGTPQAPIARDDVVQVRPGSATDIAVLANDEQPEGEPLSLVPELVTPLGPGEGLLFASRNVLRYVAPDEVGTYEAVYAVTTESGLRSQARVTIQVVAPDDVTNSPPNPRDVSARVVAGELVVIPIPIYGIDPNGDTVTLLGQSSPPLLGSVVSRGPDSITYRASDYAVGTDSFTYEVVDALGARATGTITVGVAPAGSVDASPLALPDEVSVRPGTTIAVPVLENDRDPFGLPLKIVSVESTAASFTDEVLLISAGAEEGEFGVLYAIENSRGSTAYAWLTVTVDRDAPLPVPETNDVTVGLGAIIDEETVDVDLSDVISIADGDAAQLEIALPVSQTGVEQDGFIVSIDIGERSRIVPFTVFRSEDPAVQQTALIFVPGHQDSLPQLDPAAEPVTTVGQTPVTIPLAEQILTVNGNTPLLTGERVVPQHSDGSNIVVDSSTIRFTAAPGFSGQASVAIEVTDGDSPRDPEGRVSTVVLPITVLPDEDQPPRLLSTFLQVEPGSDRSLDLTRLTTGVSEESGDVTYTLEEGTPSAVTAAISGSDLQLQTASNATPGARSELTLRVTDERGESSEGIITIAIVSSTRPLASPQPDAIALARGSSTSINVLENDEATNPFPDTPLRLVETRAVGGGYPQGITIRASENGTIEFAASSTAEVREFTMQYRVLDATGLASRSVWGSVTVRLEDVPSQPAAPTRETAAHVDGSIALRITPPEANNSAITSYRIVADNQSFECGLQLVCVLDSLDAGRDYQFRVIARNAVGESVPSAPSEVMRVDWLPEAPTSVSARPTTVAANGGSLQVSWATVPDPSRGTPISGYIVRVTGNGVDVQQEVPSDAVTAEFPNTDGQLQTGRVYSVAVAAVNAANVPVDRWQFTSTSVTAIGPPSSVGTIFATRNADDPDTIDVNWGAANAGGATNVLYTVRPVRVGTDVPECTSSGDGRASGSRDQTFEHRLPRGQQFVYVIVADNGWYCSTSVSRAISGVPNAPTASLQVTVRANGDAADLRVTGEQRLPGVDYFQVRVNTNGSGWDAWRDFPVDGGFVTRVTAQNAGLSTAVELRACTGSQDSSGKNCSTPQRLGSASPYLLAAIINTCVIDQQLSVSAPPLANGAVAPVSFTIKTRFQVDGSWTEWSSPADPAFAPNVPADATRVQVTGIVTANSQNKLQTWEDTNPSSIQCGAEE
ncbi:Ig-like domain-containing protein [Humidisolicoccus flavus]|uniref:Ig-like domain-containing protein n=1 Tax=Humidisolicoccus flavus TaxID=3111414 RepID=UPI0032517BBA